jgi:glutamate-1-semialdehyde 2,1-aminomutase
MKRDRSEELFEKARNYFPGGVNSPARAYKAVDGSPLFMEKGSGCRITDADGNEYIDFCCSFGPLILGHAHPKVIEMVTTTLRKGTSFGTPTEMENELAAVILKHDSYVDQLRFVNSGTEATMSTIRLARGFTGKNKVIKFDGCYHGHVDPLLVKAGSGLATLGTSSSAGVPEHVANDTIVLPLNDKKALQEAVKAHQGEIAAMIIEPVPANTGLLLQDPDYLETLRSICDDEGILLIFDEVISGFRLGFEGAAGHYGIRPDLVAYGKIIGGGMPVGAFGGKEHIMQHLSPEGKVYQAGTLSGNPVAMAAGLAQLTECTMPGFYEDQEKRTRDFAERVEAYAKDQDYPFHMVTIGSIFWCAFSEKGPITRPDEIPEETPERFRVLHRELLHRGVHMGPSGFEMGFVSTAHGEEDLKEAADAFKEALDVVYSS